MSALNTISALARLPRTDGLRCDITDATLDDMVVLQSPGSEWDCTEYRPADGGYLQAEKTLHNGVTVRVFHLIDDRQALAA